MGGCYSFIVCAYVFGADKARLRFYLRKKCHKWLPRGAEDRTRTDVDTCCFRTSGDSRCVCFILVLFCLVLTRFTWDCPELGRPVGICVNFLLLLFLWVCQPCSMSLCATVVDRRFRRCFRFVFGAPYPTIKFWEKHALARGS